MNNKEIGELILYVVQQVVDSGGYTTTIRLVKFLYLIDLEHYRRFGKTLTDMKWIFYHYGPYALVLPEIGRSLGFYLEKEEFETKKGYKGRYFRIPEPQQTPGFLSYSEDSIINGLLQIWADQETPNLLSYVYETEPVLFGTFGEELDFTLASPGSRYYELFIPVDKKVVKEIKEGLNVHIKEETEEYVIPTTKLDDYPLEAMKFLDDVNTLNLSGIYPNIKNEEGFEDTLPKSE